MAGRPERALEEPDDDGPFLMLPGRIEQEFQEMMAQIDNPEMLNRIEQDRARAARFQRVRDYRNRIQAERRARGPGGNEVFIVGGGNMDVVEGRSKIEIPLAVNFEKILTPEAYQEMLAKSQPEGAAAASGSGDRVSYLFQDLQLKELQDTKGKVEEEALKEGILTLESYLNGKKKGKDKIKSAFSLIPGEVEEARARYYFLKLDSNLLEKLARTFGDDAIIKATLTVKRASGSDNSSGASTSASGSGCMRPSVLGHLRHHPYRRTGLNSERADEMVYLIEPEGGVQGQGKMVSELLDPSSLGVKLLHVPTASANYTLFFDETTKNIVKRYKPCGDNSCSGSVHFLLSVSIESTNMPSPVAKVQLGAQQVLQYMYELEDSSKEVTIVASNGAELKCHRVILMAQIPSFHTMLSPDRGMAEAQTGRIELNENSEDGLREFIRFLYGFEVNLEGMTSDMALELFQLGNKYQVKKLDDAMKNFLCEKKIDFYKVDTILELYFIVRNVDCLEELRTHALTEMSKLSREALKGSDYFKSLCSEDQVDLLFVLLEWNK